MLKYSYTIEDITKSKKDRRILTKYNLTLEQAEKLRDSKEFDYLMNKNCVKKIVLNNII